MIAEKLRISRRPRISRTPRTSRMPRTSGMPRTSRPQRRHLPGFVALGLVLVLTACSPGGGSDRAGHSASPSPSVQLTTSPRDGATTVAPATPVTVRATRGTLKSVRVVSGSGDAVDGALTSDGTQWRSRGKLGFGARYTVTATTPDGTEHEAGSFATIARPGADRSVFASSVLGDHKTYGVGMPIILRLDQPLRAVASRAAFEDMLTVRSQPATSGAWGWVNNSEVHFRPRTYWAADSTVHVALDSAGRSLGGDLWGRTDLTVDFTIGVHREMRADASAHRFTVLEGGRVVRTMPASLGKPAFPSSSGTMVIMTKQRKALFDSSTYGLPVDGPNGYRTPVEYAMRLTWGGEFIHAAPWSVGDQGRRNVSHGCINLSTANAKWVFDRVRLGDPVVVRNTGTPVAVGNGWTDFTATFPAWLDRSATGEKQTA
ncbi:MAG TPA: Ig-like domain-containing protein [Mycobacteriales bacterium]|nr:Ig-like domain-containing protein [Mycobacteriales bacterium]